MWTIMALMLTMASLVGYQLWNIDLELTQELLKQLAWDPAIDMSCDKVNFAEERLVWWTTYSNFHGLSHWNRQPRDPLLLSSS